MKSIEYYNRLNLVENIQQVFNNEIKRKNNKGLRSQLSEKEIQNLFNQILETYSKNIDVVNLVKNSFDGHINSKVKRGLGNVLQLQDINEVFSEVILNIE